MENDFGSIYLKISVTSLAVLDTITWANNGQLETVITRVNVPNNSRNKGYSRALLKECCKRADKIQRVLTLTVSPDNSPRSLDYWQLIELYSKFDFVLVGDSPFMKRIPRGMAL